MGKAGRLKEFDEGIVISIYIVLLNRLDQF